MYYKLTNAERQEAFRGYARRHGYYVRTVRAVTSLRNAAFREYRMLNPKVVLS